MLLANWYCYFVSSAVDDAALNISPNLVKMCDGDTCNAWLDLPDR